MGSYLSQPITEKHSFDEAHDNLEFGVSGMQGWRVSMEDAHCCLPDIDDKNNALFGVFDGHGGQEVAEYCAQNFHKFLLDTDAYQEGDIETALKNTFMSIDEAITSDEVIKELKALGGIRENAEEEADEAAMLLEEANMPIEELLARIKDNVKDKLTESGILLPDGGSDSDEGDEEKEEKKEITNGEEKPVANGHSEKSENNVSGKSSGRSRKQKQPIKRTEDGEEAKSGGGSSSGVSSGSSGASNSVDKVSSGSGSSFGGSSGGSSKVPFEESENCDPDFEEEEEEEVVDDEEEEEEDDDDSSDDDDSEEDDEDGFEDAEGVDFQQGAGDEVGKDSGSTAIVALIHNSKLYVGNVGDSRCVLCRNGSAYEMSIDHKPEDVIEKNRIEAAGGKITADGRVNGGLNLSRAIGDHAYKTNKDLPPEAQVICAVPDIKETLLTKDDTFMVLACDGIWNVMTSEEVIEFVNEKLTDENTKLSEICEDLFDRCMAPDTNNDGSGCDNMTCLIVRFKHDANGNIKINGQTKRSKVSDTDENDSNKKSKKAKLS